MAKKQERREVRPESTENSKGVFIFFAQQYASVFAGYDSVITNSKYRSNLSLLFFVLMTCPWIQRGPVFFGFFLVPAVVK